jgi:hypothetical protein
MEVVGMILIALGVIVSFVGFIRLLVVTFQESILWGLGCLFVPFVWVIFLIMHWDKAGKPFLIELAGVVTMIVGLVMMKPNT